LIERFYRHYFTGGFVNTSGEIFAPQISKEEVVKFLHRRFQSGEKIMLQCPLFQTWGTIKQGLVILGEHVSF
jgi:hypothetical protein